MDFALAIYKHLLDIKNKSDYSFQTFHDFLKFPKSKCIILRHDVDKLPENSLVFAKIQAEIGARGSYYFRAMPESWDEDVIREISSMGHEVGYHYEDVDLAVRRIKEKGKRKKWKKIHEDDILEEAIGSFERNLEKLRKIVPVKTICMHGSPLSKFDNKLLWENYDYRNYGIIGEPYFDIDFSKVLYLTDTGRRWDGNKASIRDKIQDTKFKIQDSREEERGRGPGTRNTEPGTLNLADQYHFHSTNDIIKAAEAGELPDQIMMTFHPQRWTNKPFLWLKELVLQNIKNQVKRHIIIKNK